MYTYNEHSIQYSLLDFCTITVLYRRGSDCGYLVCLFCVSRGDLTFAWRTFSLPCPSCCLETLLQWDRSWRLKVLHRLVIQTTPASEETCSALDRSQYHILLKCLLCIQMFGVVDKFCVLCFRAPARNFKLWDQCRQIVHRQFDFVHSQVSSTLNGSIHSVRFYI